MADPKNIDVIVVGAGISGIDAGYHLKTHCPDRTFAILEGREALGGTWDLFRYPGIRSDSDMFTFGFHFKPWSSPQAIAPGEDILKYLKETAAEFGIDKHIRFGKKVISASWSSSGQKWSLRVREVASGAESTYTCKFLFGCTGYYDYDNPHFPTFPGQERFPGRIIHPQKWGKVEDEHYKGKKVAIIGSGATAVTLLPNIAANAKHVTMVQRTPSYMFAMPGKDGLAKLLMKLLPICIVYPLMRLKNAVQQALYYNLFQTFPAFFKKYLLNTAESLLGGVMSHDEFRKTFTPPYNPWDQRLCLTPDGDFYSCIRRGEGSVCTGHIKTFTETGIEMADGRVVEADVIVSATGLTLQRNFPMSTMKVDIDGRPYVSSESMIYKGTLVSGVPNFAFIMGYTNSSWTLKADLSCSYFSRLINYMSSNGYTQFTPKTDNSVEVDDGILTSLKSGYIHRMAKLWPKQGKNTPWRMHNNYFKDKLMLEWGSMSDHFISFQ